jgi:hypothetical protein
LQPVAAWLVARPLNGILALALTMLLPLSPVLSGLVMAHLVFANGVRVPVLQGIVAGASLAVFAVLLQASVGQIVASAIAWWLPVFVIAALARQWRSTTLALQVSAIVAIAVTAGFFIVLGDPADYWNEVISQSIEMARQAGLNEQADLLSNSQALVVSQMTMLFVATAWSFYVLVTMLGYALYQLLPDRAGVYGRFCDLNFGRVLATILALASVGAVLTGSTWLQNLGFVAFAVFWVQGLAILHWLCASRRLPVFVLVVVYAALPFLNLLLVVTLAVVGYMDAWFDIRARTGIRHDKV